MAAITALKLSQLSCSSVINRHSHLQRRSFPATPIRHRSFVVKCIGGRRRENVSPEDEITLNYAADVSNKYVDQPGKPYPAAEENAVVQLDTDGLADGQPIQQKKGAKIHDFCFGIPYGGLILCSGLLGSIFSRNLATLGTGVLYGGSLLALSTFSLKIWRQGKSSLPFILGQAVLSGVLCWKNLEAYSLTKRLIPSGVLAAFSGAMICFYCYVVLSGGNPPPKKLKSTIPAPA